MRKQVIILWLIIIIIVFPKNALSQKKFLLGSFWGFPSASGFGYGNLGIEFQPKKNKTTWQFSFNMAVGTLATDIGTPNRKWITADRINPLFNSSAVKNPLFYTLFIEIGDRKISGGWWKPFNDTALYKQHAFEVNPGIGLGKNFKLFKKLYFQLIAAPKTIFAFHKDKYNDIGNRNYFYKKYSDINIGFRLAANFCYRL